MKLDNLLFANMNDPSHVLAPNHNGIMLISIQEFFFILQWTDREYQKVIVPLMIYADGIIMDQNGQLCQEPHSYQ